MPGAVCPGPWPGSAPGQGEEEARSSQCPRRDSCVKAEAGQPGPGPLTKPQHGRPGLCQVPPTCPGPREPVVQLGTALQGLGAPACGLEAGPLSEPKRLEVWRRTPSMGRRQPDPLGAAARWGSQARVEVRDRRPPRSPSGKGLPGPEQLESSIWQPCCAPAPPHRLDGQTDSTPQLRASAQHLSQGKTQPIHPGQRCRASLPKPRHRRSTGHTVQYSRQTTKGKKAMCEPYLDLNSSKSTVKLTGFSWEV